MKYNFTLYSLILMLLVSACIGQEKTKGTKKQANNPTINNSPVVAEKIRIPAQFMRKFKTDVNGTETIGNKIGNVVRTITQDSQGTYWFGLQEGLSSFDGKELMYYDIKDDLNKGITVKVIKEDQQGNLWIGHTSGITKFDGTYFSSYSEKDGLVHNDVWALEIDNTGTIWIGTLLGVNTFDGERFKELSIPDVIRDPNRGVSSAKMVPFIKTDSKNRLWFANSGGAFVFDGTSLAQITEKDGLCNNMVNAILEDSKGNFWFTTSYNGLCIYDGETYTSLADKGYTGGKEAGAIIEDGQGNFWFSVKGDGVYRYDGKTFTNFNEDDGLISHAIMSLYEDDKKRIWAGGFNGISRFDGNSFIEITRDGPW